MSVNDIDQQQQSQQPQQPQSEKLEAAQETMPLAGSNNDGESDISKLKEQQQQQLQHQTPSEDSSKPEPEESSETANNTENNSNNNTTTSASATVPLSPPVPSPSPAVVSSSNGNDKDKEAEVSEDADVEMKQDGQDTPKKEPVTEGTEETTEGTEGDSKKHELEDAQTEQDSKRVKTEEQQEQQQEQQQQPQQQSSSAAVSPMTTAPPAAETSTTTEPSKSIDPPEGAEPGLPKHQLKAAQQVLRSVKRLKDAGPFLQPVDAVKLNVPTYYEVITNPMDIAKMEKKLNGGEYAAASDISKDMDLIVANCEAFNGVESIISNMARSVRTSFQKHMANMPSYELPPPPPPKQKKKPQPPPPSANTKAKSQRSAAVAANAAVAQTSSTEKTAPTSTIKNGVPTIRRDSVAENRPKREIHPPKPKDLMYGDAKPRKKKFQAELKFCGQVLKELQSKKHGAYSYPFLQPVDPVALNCPDYPKIITHPMDLSTIQQKYNDSQYANADEFEADVRLMFQNCYTFNPEGTPVNMMGHRLESVFDKKWVDKPVAPPTPPPQPQSVEDSDDYFSDMDESQVTNSTIQFIEEQIRQMQEQVANLKKEALKEKRERSRSAGKRGGRKNSTTKRKSTGGGAAAPAGGEKNRRGSGAGAKNAAPNATVLTYTMKEELSEKISTGDLTQAKLEKVVEIIKENMPHLSDDEEIELDINELKEPVILKLYNYVMAPDVPKKKQPRSTNTKTKKKNKPLTEEEQTRQIEQLTKKLQEFDESNGQVGAKTIGNVPPPPQLNDSDSSDDEGGDSSDESSEEE